MGWDLAFAAKATFAKPEHFETFRRHLEPGRCMRELKTELLDREEAIRSKTRGGVEQELWGILLAYDLVRLEMERVGRNGSTHGR